MDVTLKTGGWPYGPMPPAKDQKENPATKAYADVLRAWLDQNPGVKLEAIEFDVWDQQALTTAVTGGTAPAFYPGNVLGGWNNAATKSAFVQGLAADVTALIEEYRFADKMADYVRPIWDSWQLDGAYYAAPQGFGAGNGVYYRRDLVREEGLAEPQPGWTWDDLATLAVGLTEGQRKGIALQAFGLEWWLNTEGWSLLTRVPAPATSWNWTYDYTSRADVWIDIVGKYRTLAFDDGAVLSDVSFADPDVTAAFSQGRVAMMPNNQFFMLGDPNTADTPGNLAKKLGKPINDVVGWIQHPVGTHGNIGNTQPFLTVLSFSPDLDEDALDKAMSLHDYMTFGDGYVDQKKAAYDATKDLQKVYTDPTPLRKDAEIEGVPGTLADAWGEQYAEAVRAAAAIPLLPAPDQYLPVEANQGPNETAEQDAQSRWMYERGDLDVRADLQKVEQTRNQQAESFTSSVSDEEFVAGAKEYFAALDAFWAEHAPEFSSQVFRPWYEQTVVPALAG